MDGGQVRHEATVSGRYMAMVSRRHYYYCGGLWSVACYLANVAHLLLRQVTGGVAVSPDVLGRLRQQLVSSVNNNQVEHVGGEYIWAR